MNNKFNRFPIGKTSIIIFNLSVFRSGLNLTTGTTENFPVGPVNRGRRWKRRRIYLDEFQLGSRKARFTQRKVLTHRLKRNFIFPKRVELLEARVQTGGRGVALSLIFRAGFTRYIVHPCGSYCGSLISAREVPGGQLENICHPRRFSLKLRYCCGVCERSKWTTYDYVHL